MSNPTLSASATASSSLLAGSNGTNQISGSLKEGSIKGEYTALTILQKKFCNLNDFTIFPIDEIRSQLPTAAELSAYAFSDDDADDEKKNESKGKDYSHESSSDSSGSQHKT